MTLPSLPPDVNIASWIGCHRTWKMLEFKVKLSGVYTLKKLLYPPPKKRTAYRAGLLLVTSKCLHLLLQIAQVKQLRREDQLFFQKPTQMCSLLKQSSISSSVSIRIHHLEQMISAGSDEPVAILIPSTVHDCRFVRMDCRENLDKTWVMGWCHKCHMQTQTCPDFGSQSLMGCWLSLLPDTTMPLCGCQSTHLKLKIIRMSTWGEKVKFSLDVCSMSSQHLLLITPLEVPNSHLCSTKCVNRNQTE